jgi:hypothetical protein
VASQLPATFPDADDEAEGEADTEGEPDALVLGDGSSSEPPPLHAVSASTLTSPAPTSPARRRDTVREKFVEVTGAPKL